MTLAAVAPPARILRPETHADSQGRWEMIDPKMVRANRLSPALNEAASFAKHRNGDAHPPIAIPAFASIGSPTSLFFRKP